MDLEEYNLALNKMTHYLSIRDHSLKELHTKLSRKFSSQAVENALEKAIANKWITSPLEMAQKIKSMLDKKHKGHKYICQYLEAKGLPPQEMNEEIEISKACAILEKQFQCIENLTKEQQHKAVRLLSNRGFDHETISKVIYEIY